MADLTDLTQEAAQSAQTVQSTGPAEEAELPRTRAFHIWRTVFVVVPLLFVLLLALRLYQTNQSEQRASGLAPPFAFTTFDGQAVSLDDLRGQGVVLNFWASWCDPCRDEAELLEMAWRREQGNGIVFLGLDYLDQEPAAQAYLAEFDITYANGPDLQSQAARRYGIKGVPETFFITPEGAIAETVIGPITNQARLDQLLDEIRPSE